VVSSGDLVARFEAAWSPEQIESHYAARDVIDALLPEAFKEIGRRVRAGKVTEFEIQQWFAGNFKREGIVTEDLPIVAVNANSGNPHYEPKAEGSAQIKEGDFVLLDVWGKKNTPHAVYYDITWTGVIGTPTDRHVEIFNIVTGGRDAGVKKVQEAYAGKRRIAGWEVDQATREHITNAGYGEYFVHRTGHSIGEHVHGNGANMDNLETKDDREIIPNTCFSVEPGVYLPEFGVRSEVNVLIHNGAAEVTGKIQRELVLI
jgi:Xaa-Pro dipeptidase